MHRASLAHHDDHDDVKADRQCDAPRCRRPSTRLHIAEGISGPWVTEWCDEHAPPGSTPIEPDGLSCQAADCPMPAPIAIESPCGSVERLCPHHLRASYADRVASREALTGRLPVGYAVLGVVAAVFVLYLAITAKP